MNLPDPNETLPRLFVRADERRGRRLPISLLGVAVMLLLAATWWLAAHRAAPELGKISEQLESARSDISRLEKELESARQELSITSRGDQVSTAANETLRETLREREEEIAALQADLAFFQRLVGGREPKKGLRVQGIVLRPIEGSRGYAFRTTLTQTLRRGEVTKGKASISIEGIRDNQLLTLRLQELPAHLPEGEAIDFSFKYFQAIDGSFVLPEGFSPNRLLLIADSEQGERVNETFSWQQALAAGEPEHVWQ